MKKLLETLLTSEFTFGFELEAYVSKNMLNQYIVGNDREKDWDMNSNEEIWGLNDSKDEDDENQEIWLDDSDDEPEYDIEQMYSDLENKFSKYFGNDIEVISDGSLDLGGFEFPTPPMSLTPANVKHCIEFLDDCHKSGIYTDHTCGFHVHFSFPQMTVQDMAWIVCQIALNDGYIREITKFDTGDYPIDFLSRWANTDFLYNIRKCFESDSIDTKELSSILSSDKYRILRLHPQKTIEWRGPRNFLNDDNLDLIYKFFYKLINVSKIFAKCMDEKSIKGVSRANFDKMIDFTNIDTKIKDFKNVNENNSDIYLKIAKKIVKNPLNLLKIKDYHNFDYATLLATIKAVCSQYNDKSFESMLIELRYKPFKSILLLTLIIAEYPEFINYVDHGFTKVLSNLIHTYSNIYNLVGKANTIKPEIMNDIIKTVKKELPMYNLNSYVTGVKSNPNSKVLTRKSTIQEFINIYGFDKVDKAFARKGLILQKYLN